jgi:microcystin-dependent protein
MSSPFVSEIRMVGFNFPPRGWAFCNGQTMPISQNTALFSLLGTTYGGNGSSTFALPNLQGSAPMYFGQGPGLSDYVQGEVDGVENVTLLTTEMPAHNHNIQVVGDLATSSGLPGSNNIAIASIPTYNAGPATVQMQPLSTSVVGSNLPHNNMQPYLAVNFVIALQGIFPARN